MQKITSKIASMAMLRIILIDYILYSFWNCSPLPQWLHAWFIFKAITRNLQTSCNKRYHRPAFPGSGLHISTWQYFMKWTSFQPIQACIVLFKKYPALYQHPKSHNLYYMPWLYIFLYLCQIYLWQIPTCLVMLIEGRKHEMKGSNRSHVHLACFYCSLTDPLIVCIGSINEYSLVFTGAIQIDNSSVPSKDRTYNPHVISLIMTMSHHCLPKAIFCKQFRHRGSTQPASI